MTAFIAIVRKDLQLFRTDRRAMLMQIVAPIVISAFFGFVFSRGASNSDPARIKVKVSDEDGSVVSRDVVARLATERVLHVEAAPAGAARDGVRRGRAVVAVVLPAGFGAAATSALFRGAGKPEVALLYDPSHAAELALIRGLLTQHAMQAVSQAAFSSDGIAAQIQMLESAPLEGERKAALRDLLRDMARLAAAATPGNAAPRLPGLSLPYDIHEEAVTSQASVPYNGFAHAFAGMSVQFILFAGINQGIGILLDKQRGVWKRLRAAPISKPFALGAKTASGTLIGFLNLAIVFVFATALFGVRVEGSLVGFVGVLFSVAFMASTFGLLIAALGRTPEATRGISIFAVLIMVMLGGAWVPTFVFPAWLQKATLFIPTRWAVDGIESMTWRGLPLSSALPAIGVLMAFSIFFGLLATWRFDWESE